MNDISEECTAVALYGIEATDNSVAAYYNHILQWFHSLGHSPDRMSIHGPGHSGRWVGFRRAQSNLETHGFGGITDLHMNALTPGARIPANDYLLSASYSAKYSYACIVCRTSIATLSPTAICPFLWEIIKDVVPKYGIGYTRAHRLGPLMYAVGICQGLGQDGYGVGLRGAEREEADRISRWGDGMAAQVWERGILRDVYPWNFLTRIQLESSINAISLERWIQLDPRRGRLSKAGEIVALWEVDEANIADVRQLLSHSGIIFEGRPTNA
jgi:hypothetical protein